MNAHDRTFTGKSNNIMGCSAGSDLVDGSAAPLELLCRTSAQVGQVVYASVDPCSAKDYFRGSERRRWPPSLRRPHAAAFDWPRRIGRLAEPWFEPARSPRSA